MHLAAHLRRRREVHDCREVHDQREGLAGQTTRPIFQLVP
jgi:hypothetical protein